MEQEAADLADQWADVAEDLETYAVKPRRSDVDVRLVAVAWTPYWEIGYASARGSATHDRVAAY
jgi:hypothetical protein